MLSNDSKERGLDNKQTSSYRTDNDIFNIRQRTGTEPLKDAKYYSKIVKQQAESNIDQEFRSRSPFYNGKRNEGYISQTFKSCIIEDANDNRNAITPQVGYNGISAIINQQGNMKDIINQSYKKIDDRSKKPVQAITELKAENVKNQNNEPSSLLKRDTSCKNSTEDQPKICIEIKNKPEKKRCRVSSCSVKKKDNSSLIFEEHIFQKEMQPTINKKDSEIQQKENQNFNMSTPLKQNDMPVNVLINQSSSTSKLCDKCKCASEKKEGPNQNPNPVILAYKDTHDIKNMEEKKFHCKSMMAFNEQNEKIKFDFFDQRKKIRESFALKASDNFIRARNHNKSLNEKNLLQEKNQIDEFFFYKENRDPYMEKAKIRNRTIENIISKHIAEKIADPRGEITKLCNAMENKVLPETENNDKFVHEPFDHLNEDLLEQMKMKNEKNEQEKINENLLIQNLNNQMQEKTIKETKLKAQKKKKISEEMIKGNSVLIDIKNQIKEDVKKKELKENEFEKKSFEKYQNQQKEISVQKEQMKHSIRDTLLKQMEDKSKRQKKIKEQEKKTSKGNSMFEI